MIYLLNNKLHFNQMENDNAEMFNDITMSKRKNIDNANVIFGQSTSKEYDYIV